MIYFPFIGAFLEAAGMIFEKKMLKIKGMNYKNYTVFGFLAIVIASIPFLIFNWRLDLGALSAVNLAVFGLIIFFSILANLLIFYSLKRENITEFEPAWLMQPLFTIILAVIFYPGERNRMIFLLALIASVSLIAAHVKRMHFVFDKYFGAVVLGSFFFAAELVLSKIILEYYSPFTFYFIRCAGIFLVSFLIFRPSWKVVTGKTSLYLIFLGLLWTIYRAIIYYGYAQLGIVFTTIIFILSPVLMFIFAVIFLKERPSLKQIISTGVILACVAAAAVINGH